MSSQTSAQSAHATAAASSETSRPQTSQIHQEKNDGENEDENRYLRESGSPPFPALLNFLKGMFGAGILAIPGAFKHTGVVLGLVLYSLVGAGCAIAMVALVYVKHELQARQLEHTWMDRHREQIEQRRKQRSLSDTGIRESRRLGETEQLLQEEAQKRSKRGSSAELPLWDSQHLQLTNGGVARDKRPSSGSIGQHSDSERDKTKQQSTQVSSNKDAVPDDDTSASSGEHKHHDEEVTIPIRKQSSVDQPIVAGTSENSFSIETYAEVGEAAMGKVGRILVETHVVVLEWAFCAGFVFVGYRNLQSAYRLAPVEVDPPTKLTVGLISTPLLILLSWIKQLKDLWFISLCGLIVYLLGVMGVTFYEGIREIANDNIGRETEEISPMSMIKFIATAVYSLEGINLVLPIESSLKDQRNAAKVIGWGTAAYTFLCALFGAFGYFVGFGTCEGSRIVTDCLTGNEAVVVSVTLVIALFFTHALTLFPATEIVERKLFDPADDSTRTLWWCRLIRVLEVLLTVIVGLMVDSFEKFSGFIGALMMSTVGFILPALFVWSAFNGKDAWPWYYITRILFKIKQKAKSSKEGIEMETTSISRSYETHDAFGSILSPARREGRVESAEGKVVFSSAHASQHTEHDTISGDRRVDTHGRLTTGSQGGNKTSGSTGRGSISVEAPGKLMSMEKRRSLGFWGSLACVFAIIFGGFIMVFGIYSSLQDL
eukprot:gb/GECG01016313.1/.p1 GENE.gb/GECG01016313.1/~~gb/GECG01016313.1/.p1  ORF type:complete len:716 (+),score=80.94 gb/GECG01016313.1/:1-2148(+)